jgi:hypothetical protein
VTAYPWPSRTKWAAKAEQAIRTFCTPDERLERALPGAVWSTLAEDIEMEELAAATATTVRPLLTAEINRIKACLPDRPTKSRARGQWFCALDGQRYEDACNLGTLEEMRRDIARAVRDGHWGTISWHAGRLHDHYPQITLPAALVAGLDRMRVIGLAVERRRGLEADRIVAEAVAAEVALRASDEGWAQELERRERIDGARNGRTVHRAS